MTPIPIYIKAFRDWLTSQLLPLYAPQEATAIAQWLLEDLTGQAWGRLAMHPQKALSSTTHQLAKKLARRLITGEPIQYVLSKAPFYGRDFMVNEHVLIPRPETEELVHWVLKELSSPHPFPHQILDIGTGSGCIPITLQLELGKAANVQALDVSSSALEVAKVNAEQLGAPVIFHQRDILSAQHDDFEGLSVVVSNPPYVRKSERQYMHDNVLAHEPATALFVADEDPTIFYEKIADCAFHWLRPGGMLFFEINEAMGERIKDLLQQRGYLEIIVRQDLKGKDRMVKARRPIK